jgi:hypothetical protein
LAFSTVSNVRDLAVLERAEHDKRRSTAMIEPRDWLSNEWRTATEVALTIIVVIKQDGASFGTNL